MNRRTAMSARYDIVHVSGEFVFISDRDDGARSVTNDAELVVAEVAAAYGMTRRIVYRDSSGDWDELVHDRGRFIDYKPTPNRAAQYGGLL